jgi:hypothetical protein
MAAHTPKQKEHGKQHERLVEVRREQSAGSGPRECERKERHMTRAGDERQKAEGAAPPTAPCGGGVMRANQLVAFDHSHLLAQLKYVR